MSVITVNPVAPAADTATSRDVLPATPLRWGGIYQGLYYRYRDIVRTRCPQRDRNPLSCEIRHEAKANERPRWLGCNPLSWAEHQLMVEYGITFDGRQFCHQQRHFDRVADAIAHAQATLFAAVKGTEPTISVA